jgi:hypothetical protein
MDLTITAKLNAVIETARTEAKKQGLMEVGNTTIEEVVMDHVSAYDVGFTFMPKVPL